MPLQRQKCYSTRNNIDKSHKYNPVIQDKQGLTTVFQGTYLDDEGINK